MAYGGAFYAFVDVEQLGLDCTIEHSRKLVEKGIKIKHAIMESVSMQHPFEPDMNFLYGTIFTGKAKNPHHHSRNVCVFADGELDRCPTGTGVSARAAIHHARGELKTNKSIVIESIIGSTFSVKILRPTSFGGYDAVVPEVAGDAFLSGKNTFWVDPKDPLKKGFIV